MLARVDIQNRQVEIAKELFLEAQNQQRAYEAQVVALKEVREQADGVLGQVMLSSRAWENSFYAKAEALGEGNVLKGIGMQLGEIGKTFLTSLSPANLLAQATSSIIDETIKMVGTQDRALASFNKSTGAAGAYDQVIRETRENNTEFAVTIGQSAEAMGALFTQFRQFTNLSAEGQAEAAAFTVQMEALGVTSDTTAGIFNDAVSGLKMDVGETTTMVRGLAGAADQLGISQGEMMQEFKASMPILAAYGKDAPKIFSRVAAAAKAAGLSTGALLGTMQQFDTFQGAAEAVSGLNAILGGSYLNSMQMVNATEDERVRLLLQSFEATGKNFSSLSKFEQKAIAAKMGITDMAEANKLLGMSVSAFDSHIAKTEEGAMSQEEMAEVASKAASAMEKMEAIFQQLAIATQPIIDGIHFIISGIQKLSDLTGNWLSPALLGLGAIYLLLSVRKKQQAALDAADLLRKAQQAQVEQAQIMRQQVINAQMDRGTASRITSGRATDAASFSNARFSTTNQSVAASQTQMAATAGPAAAGTRSVGMAASTSVGPIVLMVGAVALLVAGIALMAYSFYKILELMFEFPDRIGDVALGMLQLGAAVGILAGAFFLLAPIAIPAAAAMAVIGIGLVVLGVGALVLGAGMVLLAQGFEAMVTLDPLKMLTVSLTLLAVGGILLLAAPALFLAALLIGLPAILLGVSFLALGMGFKELEEIDLGHALAAAGTLILIGLALMAAAIPLMFAGLLIGIPAILLGAGFILLGMGFAELEKIDLMAALAASATLIMIAGALLLAAIPLGIAGLAIGIPAMLIGGGFILLAKGFAALEEVSFIDALVASAMLIPIGIVLAIAAVALAAAGVLLLPAALMIAPSLLLMSVGLNAMSDIDPMQIMMMGLALIVFAAAMSVIGLMFLNPFMTVGFVGMAAGLMGIGLGLLFIDPAKMDALQLLTDNLANADADRINMVAEAIERIAEATNNIAPFQTIMLDYMFQSLNEIDSGGEEILKSVASTFETVAAMPPDSGAKAAELMEGITGLVEAASEAAESKWFGEQTSVILDKVKDLMGAGSGGAGAGGGGKTEVKLYMDHGGRKEFAKGIIGELAPEISKRLNISKGPTAG